MLGNDRMNLDIDINEYELPNAFVEEIASKHGITRTEYQALRLALNGLSGSSIAKELEISPEAVRKRLGESYRKFHIPGKSNKKIYNLKKQLYEQYQASVLENQKAIEDWGEAVDIKNFQGREAEILELTQWIVEQRCRLVTILGMGGIGKSILAAKTTNTMRDKFEYIIWRSLRNAPKLDDILNEILSFLPVDDRTSFNLYEDNYNKKILKLIELLRRNRCLIVLDNFESLFYSDRESHQLAGGYQDRYQNYGDLLRKVAESSHESCLLITSREKPLEVGILEGKNLPVKVLGLTGLKPEYAIAILEDKGIDGKRWDKELKCLVERYSGNPLALKMIANTLYDLFDNNVDEFIVQVEEASIYGNVRNLLDEQFNRLSRLEEQLMYWFAVNRDYVSLKQIKKDLTTSDNIKILEALESLLRRSLVEKGRFADGVKFRQQFVVMEYVTGRLVSLAFTDIINGTETKKFQVIEDCSLIKARSLDHFRELQEKSILKPLKQKLLDFFGSKETLESHLKQILKYLQEKKSSKGYAAGNIINLLRYLQTDSTKLPIDLSRWDFSDLTIWQAYFKDVKLQETKFQNSDLSGSVFSDTMSSLVSVSFSGDGNYFATGVISGEVRLWQTDGIRQLKIFKKHKAWVWTFAFSPNDKILASGSADCDINLWDINNDEKCLHTLSGHTSRVCSVAFKDDKILASGSGDRSIKIWDIETGKCQATLKEHTGWVGSVKFNPQDKDILASCSSDCTIKLWDTQTYKCIQTLRKEHKNTIYSIDFHPNGKLIVSCDGDGIIKLWDLDKGSCENLRGEQHIGKVYKVRFSYDGTIIASSGEDRNIKLWDSSTLELKKTLSGHTSQVWDISFHPRGFTIISSSDDQTIRFWDIQTGKCWNTLRGHTRDVYSVAFCPDGKILASGQDDQTIRLWNLDLNNLDLDSPVKYSSLYYHQGRIRSVAFSPDGKILASCSSDCEIKLLHIQDISNEEKTRTLTGHKNWVLSLSFSPDGNILASGAEDHTIRLWNVETAEHIKTFQHSHWVLSVAFSPDGKMIASSSADSTVKLWDVDTGKCIYTLHKHTDFVWDVAFHPDGKTFISAGDDKVIRLWDVKTGKCLKELCGHQEHIYSVAFSPDGNLIASGGGDRTIKLWDFKTFKFLHTFSKEDMYTVRCLAFSPDGKMLASGGEDEKTLLWDIRDRRLIKEFNSPHFYGDMDITNVKGLTYPEKMSLKELGAKV